MGYFKVLAGTTVFLSCLIIGGTCLGWLWFCFVTWSWLDFPMSFASVRFVIAISFLFSLPIALAGIDN